MSYKARNSLILGILVFLIVGVGTYVRGFNLPAKAEKIETEVKRIDEELQNTPNLVNHFNDLSTTLEEARGRWENRSKDIPAEDISSQTYAYFSRLIDLSGQIKLDMIFQGAEQKENYGYNIYNLKGEASFDSWYRFVWYLENGRKLYKITDMKTKGIEIPPKDGEAGDFVVGFEMVVHAYFSQVPELASAPGERAIIPNYLGVDPFIPVIWADVPPNMDGLVEIERSDLKAVIPGKAFILDQDNRIRTLAEGDEVYLGYVTRVIPEDGRIECTLNKGGIIEKVELTIRYSADETVVNKGGKGPR
ncbi:MAG: hypothetical protein OEV30_02100 [Ignavibacteria bacterium]|nr:hypothetical protein [Ignavibacteria bacterium]